MWRIKLRHRAEGLVRLAIRVIVVIRDPVTVKYLLLLRIVAGTVRRASLIIAVVLHPAINLVVSSTFFFSDRR